MVGGSDSIVAQACCDATVLQGTTLRILDNETYPTGLQYPGRRPSTQRQTRKPERTYPIATPIRTLRTLQEARTPEQQTQEYFVGFGIQPKGQAADSRPESLAQGKEGDTSQLLKHLAKNDVSVFYFLGTGMRRPSCNMSSKIRSNQRVTYGLGFFGFTRS